MPKTISLNKRNDTLKEINEGTLNIREILINDLDIQFVRCRNVKSFLKLFKQAYTAYIHKKNYTKATENLRNALLFKKDDYLANKMLKNLQLRLSRRAPITKKFL